MISAALLAAAPLEDIRGLKPYLAPGPAPWALLLVVAVGLVMAFVFFYLARRAPGEEQEAVASAPVKGPKTPRGRLDALKASQLADRGEAAKFCDQLSEILRDFVLHRYGLSTRRLTSSELMAELAERRIPMAVLDHLDAVFAACDLVKFAKVRLAPTELLQHLTSAYLVLEFAGQPPASEPPSSEAPRNEHP
ncbi:hypothetical protein J7643_15150 [bacterium]|nr:hypothetical protein [bacterium]